MKSIRLILSLSMIPLSSVSISATTAYPASGGAAVTLANSTCSTTSPTTTSFQLKVKPSYYSLSVNSLYVCTSKPYPSSMVPGASVYQPVDGDSFVKDSCYQVFSNASGSQVEVIDGVSSQLSGDFTRPPNGTYPYYFLKVGNQFKFEASLDFSGATAVANSGAAVQNPYCVTTAGTQTSLAKDVYASCSSTAGATPGRLTETKISFGLSTADTFKRDYWNSCNSLSTSTHTCNDPLGIYITDSSENFQGTASTLTSTNIVSIKKFTNPVVINDSTTSMDIKVESKRAFLVFKNPECNYLASGVPNTGFDEVKVGATGWTVDVTAN